MRNSVCPTRIAKRTRTQYTKIEYTRAVKKVYREKVAKHIPHLYIRKLFFNEDYRYFSYIFIDRKKKLFSYNKPFLRYSFLFSQR